MIFKLMYKKPIFAQLWTTSKAILAFNLKNPRANVITSKYSAEKVVILPLEDKVELKDCL